MRPLTSAKRVMNGSKGKLYLDGEYVAGVVSFSAKWLGRKKRSI